MRELTYNEQSTIIAALRFIQRNTTQPEREQMEHFIDATPLDDEQIDDLIEELNSNDVYAG